MLCCAPTATIVRTPGAVALAEYMADTSCLEHLDLRENDIRTAGQMALALSLRVNQSVTSLDIDTEAKKEQVRKVCVKWFYALYTNCGVLDQFQI